MKNLHLIAYIAVAGFSVYQVMQGRQIIWFAITLLINILLIAIELFFSFGAGKVTRDKIDQDDKNKKAEFEKFLLDNNK